MTELCQFEVGDKRGVQKTTKMAIISKSHFAQVFITKKPTPSTIFHEFI